MCIICIYIYKIVQVKYCSLLSWLAGGWLAASFPEEFILWTGNTYSDQVRDQVRCPEE